MTNKPLVSIITPCYNGESFISRLLDSVLAQTYPNLEFIIVNDGSTDNTEGVILSYRERFEERGIKFIYITKENGGVASAINRGLEIFSGDFLTWPDSDDWMTPDSIAKKVETLEANPECGLVIGQLDVRLEDSIDKSIGILRCQSTQKRNIFEDVVFEKGIYVAPLGWMVRSDMFLKACPERHIEDQNRMGQNWQMMLPVAYAYPCVFVDEIIGYYLVRSNSLSHSDKNSLTARRNKVDSFMKLKIGAIQSIKDMDDQSKSKYINIIVQRYSHIKLKLSAQIHKRDWIEEDYNAIKEAGNITFSDKAWRLRGISKAFDSACKLVSLPLRAVKSLVRRVKQR